MKVKTSFFWHLASETAIRNGWDYEEDFNEFFEKLDSKILDSVAFEAYGNQLTERDIYQASNGIASTGFTKFYKTIYEKCKEKGTSTPLSRKTSLIQQSVHSGSSDYLFFSDLEEMFS